MSVRVITAPGLEPVTVAQVRLWCRIDAEDTSQDDMLTWLIQAMREYAENRTARAFVQRTLELTLPCFPDNSVIELPYPPLVSVAWVKFIAYDGSLTTVDAADYEVDTSGEPGRIQPAYLKTWLPTRNVFNAVQVRFDAGYAPSSSPSDYRETIPAALKLWMSARICTLYDERAHLMGNRTVEIPRHLADGLLDSLIAGSRLFG